MYLYAMGVSGQQVFKEVFCCIKISQMVLGSCSLDDNPIAPGKGILQRLHIKLKSIDIIIHHSAIKFSQCRAYQKLGMQKSVAMACPPYLLLPCAMRFDLCSIRKEANIKILKPIPLCTGLLTDKAKLPK